MLKFAKWWITPQKITKDNWKTKVPLFAAIYVVTHVVTKLLMNPNVRTAFKDLGNEILGRGAVYDNPFDIFKKANFHDCIDCKDGELLNRNEGCNSCQIRKFPSGKLMKNIDGMWCEL